MGSFIEINDTLRISKDQGFPAALDITEHLTSPIATDSVVGEEYSFSAKQKLRIYKAPPVRNFLVEDINGKWLYWGLCHITEINHDYIEQVTSGKFKIIHINSPEEMKAAFSLIDRVWENNYFEE